MSVVLQVDNTSWRTVPVVRSVVNKGYVSGVSSSVEGPRLYDLAYVDGVLLHITEIGKFGEICGVKIDETTQLEPSVDLTKIPRFEGRVVRT